MQLALSTVRLMDNKGSEKFKGNIIHSAMYRSPNHYINQRVVVVGRRNSAVQIALELADVREYL